MPVRLTALGWPCNRAEREPFFLCISAVALVHKGPILQSKMWQPFPLPFGGVQVKVE